MILVAVLAPTSSNAVPARPSFQLVYQPDGTPIFIRTRGDEWYRYCQTPDGYPVLKDAASGEWRYAVPAAAGGLRSTRLGVYSKSLLPALFGLKPGAPKMPGTNKKRMLAAKILNQTSQVLKKYGYLSSSGKPLQIITNPSGVVKNLVVLANFSNTTTTVRKFDA